METNPKTRSPLLEAVNVQFHYSHDGFALQDIQVQLAPGSFNVILGPNGSGKSTLIRLLCGLLMPQTGHVCLDGKSLIAISPRRRGRSIAFLSQNEPSHLPFTVFDIVMMGRYPYQGLWPFDSKWDIQAVNDAMKRVHVDHFRNRLITELSGGEKQRVYLARALAQTPRILLLDEPASNLDLAHQIELYQLLNHFNQEEGMTIATISHEINIATRFSTQIILIRDGRILQSGKPNEVMSENTLQEIYDVPMHHIRDEKTGKTFFFPEM